MNVTNILFEELEGESAVPGFAVRVHAIGYGFAMRAAPLFARVGPQPVEQLFMAPGGKGFSGFLAQMPAENDRLFFHYADEPEVDALESGDVPPLV